MSIEVSEVARCPEERLTFSSAIPYSDDSGIEFGFSYMSTGYFETNGPFVEFTQGGDEVRFPIHMVPWLIEQLYKAQNVEEARRAQAD